VSRPLDAPREESPVRSVLLASYENAHKTVTLWWERRSYFVSERWSDGQRGIVEFRVLSFRSSAMAHSEYEVACVGAELRATLERQASAAGGAR
jgi:hypothetical protein